MKFLNLLAIGVLSASALGTASAQTVIRIVASNGDRTATQTAIGKLLATGGSTWTFQGINGVTSGNSPTGPISSTATGANFGAWSGTFNGQPVIIKVSYSGALAGDAAVASDPKIPQRFVVVNGSGSTTPPNPLNGTTLNVDYELGEADFGFSTNFQSTSPFNGVFEGHQYNPLVEEIVGVSPLGFYASPGFPADNITTQLAQLLYTQGSLSLALFTGNFDADANKTVWAIGRNTDAGQRFGAYTEIGLGTTTAVRVWQPTIVGSLSSGSYVFGGTAVSHIPWPAETVSGIFSDEGSGGYSTGAALAPVLTTILGPDAYKGRYVDEESQVQYLYPNATAGYYIGYLTPGDANNRVLGKDGVVPVQNRGVALKYNGVELTDENVRTGRYTAWLYNRILRPTGDLNTVLPGVKGQLYTALRDQIANVDAPSGGGLFNDSSFKVQRFTDGGLVVPK